VCFLRVEANSYRLYCGDPMRVTGKASKRIPISLGEAGDRSPAFWSGAKRGAVKNGDKKEGNG